MISLPSSFRKETLDAEDECHISLNPPRMLTQQRKGNSLLFCQLPKLNNIEIKILFKNLL